MWDTIIELFRNYMGTGLILAWFFAAMVYLFVKEEDKGKRILFLYVPVILLLLFFNPLFIKVIYGFVGEEVYYRVLWLLPVTIVLAYTILRIYGKLQGRQRNIFLWICVFLIFLSGSCIYTDRQFSKADNLYHIPGEVKEVCDAIEVEGREVMAAFPSEMILYVRQYSPLICMPYGREVLVDRWNLGNDLYAVMDAETVDAKELATLAKQYNCHYVILRDDKEMLGDLEAYDYILFDVIGEYRIYQDTTVYIGF